VARSRVALLTGAIVYVAAQVALNAAIRSDQIPVRDPVYSEKVAILRSHGAYFTSSDRASPPRVLALGSSRTQLAFDAAGAEHLASEAARPIRAFNFGCAAAGPMTQALYFRRLLDAGVKTDYVLIELHPGFAGRSDPPFESRWLHTYRLSPPEVDTLREYGWDLPSPAHHGWKGWVTAAHGFRMAILNRYAPDFLLCPFGLTIGAAMDAHGFVKGVTVSEAQKPRALERTREQYAPTFEGWSGGPVPTAAIQDVLARCRERHIRAAIVLCPESSEYRSWYGPVGYERVGDFAAGFGVPVVDSRAWVPDAHIADGHHLTAAGATVFTERFVLEFLVPWVRTGGATE
jgi:hypothetical protein